MITNITDITVIIGIADIVGRRLMELIVITNITVITIITDILMIAG